MVSETTSNSPFQSSRTSIQETGASRLKTTTLSPSTRKSDRSLVLFFTEVAESVFRTQPAATAVSATGGVGTTPTCTRADAHFSRAHNTVHNSLIDPHALAQGKRNLCSAFVCTRFHLVCHVLFERSFCPSPSGHVLTYMLFVKTLSVLNLVCWK